MEANAREFLRKDPSNQGWYENLNFILSDRLSRMKLLSRFEEKTKKLSDSVKSCEKTAVWQQTITDIHEQILHSILVLNKKFDQMFGNDFNRLINAIESLRKEGHPQRKDELEKYLENFIQDSFKEYWKLNSPLVLHKIEIELNLIEMEINSLKSMKNTEPTPHLTPFISNLKYHLTERLKNFDVVVMSSVEYFISLHLDVTSMIETPLSDEDLREPTQAGYTKLQIEYNNIMKKQEPLLRPNNNIWFSKWCSHSHNIRFWLSNAFYMQSLALDPFQMITGKPISSKYEDRPEIMRKTYDLLGYLTKTLWLIFGGLARKVWTSINNLKHEFAVDSEQFKNITKAFDILDTKIYSSHKNIKYTIDTLLHQQGMLTENIKHVILHRPDATQEVFTMLSQYNFTVYSIFHDYRAFIYQYAQDIGEMMTSLAHVMGTK